MKNATVPYYLWTTDPLYGTLGAFPFPVLHQSCNHAGVYFYLEIENNPVVLHLCDIILCLRSFSTIVNVRSLHFFLRLIQLRAHKHGVIHMAKFDMSGMMSFVNPRIYPKYIFLSDEHTRLYISISKKC